MTIHRERTPKRPHREPSVPDVYMPAMWPLDLQRCLGAWWRAWQRRRLYRQLLELQDHELLARDLDVLTLRQLARQPLRQLAEECRRE
ncbi:hypothetical protein [Stutzerimonas azotifigens]|uniref:hypothetical protein n=1 Tax=Stutzerimonas azotifigens TaxID=291995 RepID=UPI001F1A5F91|nr:hypothetical protein [Stutzerimonas azotifigens]